MRRYGEIPYIILYKKVSFRNLHLSPRYSNYLASLGLSNTLKKLLEHFSCVPYYLSSSFLAMEKVLKSRLPV